MSTSGEKFIPAEEGFEPNRILRHDPMPAERRVLAGGGAGKPSMAVLSNGEIVMSYIRNYIFTRFTSHNTMMNRQVSPSPHCLSSRHQIGNASKCPRIRDWRSGQR